MGCGGIFNVVLYMEAFSLTCTIGLVIESLGVFCFFVSTSPEDPLFVAIALLTKGYLVLGGVEYT